MKTIHMEIHREPNKTKVCIFLDIEILLSSLNIVEVVNIFFDLFKELALKCLGEFLCLLDTFVTFQKEKVSNNDKNRYRGSKKEREICRFYDETFKTPWGEVPFRCREIKKDGKYSIPLREIIGMPPKKQIVEETFREDINACIYASSFKKAWKTTDKVISKNTLWQLFQNHAKKEMEKEERAYSFYAEGDLSKETTPFSAACAMIDEIWVRRRLSDEEKEKNEREWEQKEQERKRREQETGKNEKKTKKKRSGWHKVKCAVVRVKKLGEKGWNRILSFVSCCSVDEYIRKASNFFNCHLGLNNIINFFCISDGDTLGEKFSKIYTRCIWILDRWHLWHHTKVLKVFGRDIRNKVWDLLKLERIDEVFKILRSFSAEIKLYTESLSDNTKADIGIFVHIKEIKKCEKSWWEKLLKELEGFITYIENHRCGIEDYKKILSFLPADEAIYGNGPIERLQGVMIGYRMKDQGKTWSKEGSENMAFLLSKFYNDEEERKKIAELLLSAYELEKIEKRAAISPEGKVTAKKDNGRHASFTGHQTGKRNSLLYKLGHSIQSSGFIGNVA